MSDDSWRRPPPKLEEYSRVTNPERFEPLHAHALSVVDRLVAEYDVRRHESLALPPDTPVVEQVRAPIVLTPGTPDAAPLAILFTSFPGLFVHIGRWRMEPFPRCGCDACAETAQGEIERFDELCANVVAGRFSEEVRLPFIGQAKLCYSLGHSGGGHAMGWLVIPRAHARELVAGGPKRIDWKPWPSANATT